ncbi:hypothetical protein [Bordetella bronchiseptica]|uniref:hypothetical protein n=1 Tax=Bordetella bronchiseptica TaxID=518 RepID=UPI000529119F|nr:hypothetical protein [Bordetella bronchiseptica]
MFWEMAGKAAMQIGSNALMQALGDQTRKAQQKVTEANTWATNRVNTANADAANKIRASNNVFAAAQSSLQNTLRTLGNRERLDAFGKQYNAAETNQARTIDTLVRGKLSARLQGAATLGALRADAAARGVGTSSEAMRGVFALQTGAALTAAADNEKYVQFDSLIQKSGLIRTSVNSVDLGQNLPNLDYGITIAPIVSNPVTSADYQPNAGVRGLVGWLSGDGVGDLRTMLGSLGGDSAMPSFVQAGDAVAQLDLGGGNYFTGA